MCARTLAGSRTRAFDAGLDVDRTLPRLFANQRYAEAVTTLRKLTDDRNGEHQSRPAAVRAPDFGQRRR